MKINSIALFIIISSLTNAVKAQNFSQEFQNNLTLDARDYVIESSNNVYTIGITEVNLNNNFRNEVRVLSSNQNGIVQNIKVFSTVDTNYSITCNQILNLADGSQIISGIYSINNTPPYRPYLMHIDQNGTINWAKKINTNRSAYPNIALLSDSTILVLFSYMNASNQTHKIFCKVDANGNFSSFKDYNLLGENVVKISANSTSFDILFSSGNLLNINNDLSTINWTRKYFHEIGITFNRTSNGDYIFAAAQVAFPGYMTIYRTDESGTILWAKYIESWHGNVQSQISIFDIVDFHFIKEDSNGDIIVSAKSEGGLDGYFNVVVDSNGNYLSNYKNNNYRNSLKVDNNTSYLAGGFINSASFNSSNFVFEYRDLTTAYQCDSILNYSFENGDEMALIPDTVSLTEIADFTFESIDITWSHDTITQNNYCSMALSIPKNENYNDEVSIYPNPSTGKVWINSKSEITQVILYNHLGKQIQTSNLSFIDISSYAKGVYFLEIQTDTNYKVIKKLIKN